MSVFLDHFYIRPTQKSYEQLKEIFKDLIGENVFQSGEHRDEEGSWGGFYIHFEKGSFLEVLNPEYCPKSQSVGLGMTCAKEYRGHFVNHVADILSENGKDVVREALPEVDPDMNICKPRPQDHLSVWSVEYSDRWFKEWGSNISKMGLLSPFESFSRASFTLPQASQVEIQDNLFWIDERLLGGQAIDMASQSGALTSVSFVTGDKSQCELEFILGDQVADIDINEEDFSFKVKDGVATLTTQLL
jgi:hypothetical protein